MLDDVGPFDAKLQYSEDWDMWVRVAKSGYYFDFVPEPLFRYFIHDSNISKTAKLSGFLADRLEALKKYESLFIKYGPSYSRVLENIGTLYLLIGQRREARLFLIKSIKANIFNLKSCVKYSLTFFGKGVYGFLRKSIK